MSNCIKITGTNTTGVAAMTSTGELISLADFKTNGASWAETPSPASQKDALPAVTDPQGLCGGLVNGVVVYNGSNISYFKSLGNKGAKWKNLPPTPVKIAGMVGDPVAGLTIFGTDKDGLQQFWQLAPSVIGAKWISKVNPPIKTTTMMAGDASGVVLVVGPLDGGLSQYSISGPDCSCGWKDPVALGFNVELVCGDSVGGFVFYGEGQMIGLDPKGGQSTLPRINSSILAMAGNLNNGITAIMQGGSIATCADLNKGPWILLNGPQASDLPAATTSAASATPAATPAATPKKADITSTQASPQAAPPVQLTETASK